MKNLAKYFPEWKYQKLILLIIVLTVLIAVLFGRPVHAQFTNTPNIQGPYAVNCNATGDTTFTVNATSNYTLNQLRIVGESGGSITTAKYGLFTGAGQTGLTLIAQATALSAITADGVNTAGNATTQASAAYMINNTSLFFNVGTAQGAACTINVYLVIYPLVGG